MLINVKLLNILFWCARNISVTQNNKLNEYALPGFRYGDLRQKNQSNLKDRIKPTSKPKQIIIHDKLSFLSLKWDSQLTKFMSIGRFFFFSFIPETDVAAWTKGE